MRDNHSALSPIGSKSRPRSLSFPLPPDIVLCPDMKVLVMRLLVRGGAWRERFPKTVEFAAGDVTDPASPWSAPARGATRSSTPRFSSRSSPPPATSTASTSWGSRTPSPAPSRSASRASSMSRASWPWGSRRGGPGGVLAESAEPRDRVWINDYERTKTLADRIACQAIAQGAPIGASRGPGPTGAPHGCQAKDAASSARFTAGPAAPPATRPPGAPRPAQERIAAEKVPDEMSRRRFDRREPAEISPWPSAHERSRR